MTRARHLHQVAKLILVAALSGALAACALNDAASSLPTDVPLPSPTPTTGPCQTSLLKLTLITSDSASGRTRYLFQYTNTGSGPCTLNGYPTVTAPGTSLKTNNVPSAYTWRTVTISTVVLAPSANAYFAIQVQPTAEFIGQTCVTAGPLIGLPGGTESVVAPTDITTCDGVINVSPFVATPDLL
jgi:hypothetical protein